MSYGGDSIFTQQVKAVRQLTQALYQNANTLPWQQPQLVVQCLEELHLALEELHVAEEELRQQNHELMVARQVLEAERQRYQDLFEFAPDAYLVTDALGGIQEANQVAASLLNLSPHRLIGKVLLSFIPDTDRRSFRTVLEQLPTIRRVQDWEVQFHPHHGDPFYAMVTVETVPEPQSNIVSLRWLIRDVTAHKQTEEHLRQIERQNLELIELDRLKNQFLATISHELRTPMTAILGFSELLSRRLQRLEEADLIDMSLLISRNGKHLLSMIEEILDFCRLRSRRLGLHLTPFDLLELIQTTVYEMRSLAAQKGLEISLEMEQGDLEMVGDRDRVRQILVNLISNAIKFTDTGHISLWVLNLPGDRIMIAVRDTGIGIAPTDQAHIFQEFWQVDQTLSRRYKGTGLGLAITKVLVELMQGTISVDSELGEGSTFWVELPRHLTLFQGIDPHTIRVI